MALARDGYRCAECGESEPSLLDVHHRVPRSAGGSDDPANLLTLCDGCHGRRHPNLQVSLSRRMIERWAIRLARWLDVSRELPDEISALSSGLRLFGVERMRAGQLDAVLAALRGENVLVVRPTGSGKTLCFQLPAVMRSGTTLVLSPLKALMSDQIAELQRKKVPGTYINSDLNHAEKRQRYDLLDHGAWKFLYCAPERFGEKVKSDEVARLARMRPAFLVVDEAHCVSRWGDDFRPDYSRIAEIRRSLGNPPVLAFTATAGTKMQDSILESLEIDGETTRLVTGADRPNIALVRHSIGSDIRDSKQLSLRAILIARLVEGVDSGKAMIFVPTVKVGEALKKALREVSLDLPFYHSNLSPPYEREQILQRFTGRLEPELRAVICTNAFGMGIDVADVRLVVSWQHPASVEDYLQEFGRAGRDGEPAVAVLLSDPERDSRLLEFMAEKSVEQAVADGRIDAGLANDRKTAKSEQIADMSTLVTNQHRCFREGLLEYLVGPKVRVRRSVTRRLLDWIFSQRTRLRSATFCCEACDSERAARLLGLPRHPGQVRARRRPSREKWTAEQTS
ncbi:MAG: RecQ family ATP-dependent DNA helicase [Gaiellaceae bacterium]